MNSQSPYKTSADMWAEKDNLVESIHRSKMSLDTRTYNRIYNKLADKSPLGNIERNTNARLAATLEELRSAWRRK